jgi:outer membrane protein TolC
MKLMNFILPTILCLSLHAHAQSENYVSLEAYLNQVKNKHDGVKASESLLSSAHLVEREAELLTEPVLFSSAQYINDSKQSPFFPYTKLMSTQFQFGVQEQTSYGTQAKLSYSYNNYQYVGSTPVTPMAYQTSPTLEISQSLWRNGFGSETGTQREIILANSEAQKFSESFRLKSYYFEAESSYWRLALSRVALQVSNEAFDRAKKIFSYSKNKSKLGLADQSEFLQASAAVEARRVDLRLAQEDEQSAARAFNSSRGLDSENVGENLQPLADFAAKDIAVKLKRQSNMQTRDDVRAAQEQSRASIANARLSQEKDKPTLEVFGQLGLNGLDTDAQTSVNQSLGSSKPTEVIGVRFNIPLNLSATSDASAGWRAQQVGAQYNLERKIFEQEKDWHDLNQKYDNALQRFEMYDKLVEAQKAKLTNEKKRHSSGRTTLVNVINFEVEFLVAQLGRLRTLSEILQIHAQLKLFGDTYESR